MPHSETREYHADEAWPKCIPKSVDECLSVLESRVRRKYASAFHGAYGDWGHIVSSLDLEFKRIATNDSIKKRVTETRLLESFVEDADSQLSSGARRHIELARLKWDTFRTTSTLFVGRHHGLPTRCIDWTLNWLTGLFFACRRHFERDGVVWWMSNDCLSSALAKQWLPSYGKKCFVEDDLEKDFIKGDERNVFVRLRYPDFMERAALQQAWITFSLEYGVHHDREIFDLGVRTCGRVVVPASMKQDLLNRLDRLGVTGRSLGLGEGCVDQVAADVANSILPHNS